MQLGSWDRVTCFWNTKYLGDEACLGMDLRLGS